MTNSATQKINELVGRRALGEPIEAELITWACDMLTEGHDAKSLRFLAGRIKNDSPRDIRDEFDQALIQLGYLPLPKREVLDGYGCFVCHCIVDGKVDLENAHKTLYQIWVKTNYDAECEGDRRFDVWMYLQDSLELVEQGYQPLLPQFEGLSKKSYRDILKREAQNFINQHCSPGPVNFAAAQKQAH